MAADINDLLGRPSNPSDYAIATTVKTNRSIGVTSLEAYDLSKWATDTPVYFITYKKTVDPATDKVTITNKTGWKALVNADTNTLTNLTLAPGYTDIGNAEGDFIESIPTSFWSNSLINGILVSLNQDGTVRDDAVHTDAIEDDAVTTPKLNDGAATSEKLSATVGFYATTTQTINNSSPSVATFTEVADYGGDFNHTTGVFVAPVDGFYHFSVGYYIDNIAADSRIMARLFKNGSQVGFSFGVSRAATHDPSANISVEIPLAAGDQVNTTAFAESSIALASGSSFSGYLIGRA